MHSLADAKSPLVARWERFLRVTGLNYNNELNKQFDVSISVEACRQRSSNKISVLRTIIIARKQC